VTKKPEKGFHRSLFFSFVPGPENGQHRKSRDVTEPVAERKDTKNDQCTKTREQTPVFIVRLTSKKVMIYSVTGFE